MPPHRIPQDVSAADWELPDPGASGAIVADRTGVVPLVSATAETRTLGAPLVLGLRLILCFKTDGGDCVVTCATGLNVTGNTTITFDTAGEMIELVSIYSGSDLRWRALACLPTTDTASLS